MVEINSFNGFMIFMGKMAWAYLFTGILWIIVGWLAIWREKRDETTKV